MNAIVSGIVQESGGRYGKAECAAASYASAYTINLQRAPVFGNIRYSRDQVIQGGYPHVGPDDNFGGLTCIGAVKPVRTAAGGVRKARTPDGGEDLAKRIGILLVVLITALACGTNDDAGLEVTEGVLKGCAGAMFLLELNLEQDAEALSKLGHGFLQAMMDTDSAVLDFRAERVVTAGEVFADNGTQENFHKLNNNLRDYIDACDTLGVQ